MLLVLCVPVYFGWKFARVQYHYYRMSSANSEARRTGPGNPNYSQLIHSYEDHRAALMKLGYFSKRQFYLNKIPTSSRRFHELLRELPKQFPTEIAKVEGHGYIYGEPVFIVVWLHPAQEKYIEKFVQEQDSLN